MTIEAVVNETERWTTPGGHEAIFTYRYRPETTDWNSISSILTHDEYGIRALALTGWAVDVGAHVGSMAIALALDHPDLRVIAIEPVPDNVRLIALNVEQNGLSDRVVVLAGGAGAPKAKTQRVAWNWNDGPDGMNTGHRFIGGSHLALDNPDITHEEVSVPSWSVSRLLAHVGADRFALLKIDCEGCEAAFLTDPAIARIDRIVGEYHPPYIDPARLHALLDATHEVTIADPAAHLGAFMAVRR